MIVPVEAFSSRVFSPLIPSVIVLLSPVIWRLEEFLPTSITVPDFDNTIIPFLEYFPKRISNFATSKLCIGSFEKSLPFA